MSAKPKSPPSATRATAIAFRKYAPALHRYLLRRIRRRSEVQDLMQEIFERYLRVDQGETVRNPQAYLFGIATHVVGDARLREEQGRLTYDSELADEIANGPELAVADDVADRLGFMQELQQAMSELPDMHRAALLLTIRDGVSHREAAQRLGLTEKTIGFYVFEARARLKMKLRPRSGG